MKSLIHKCLPPFNHSIFSLWRDYGYPDDEISSVLVCIYSLPHFKVISGFEAHFAKELLC